MFWEVLRIGLGLLLCGLAAACLWEKYRLVRGAVALPAQILDCHRSTGVTPRKDSGGWCYRVEFFVQGERCVADTNDSFWYAHNGKVGHAVVVWYNPAFPHTVERKSIGTELLTAAMAVLGLALIFLV